MSQEPDPEIQGAPATARNWQDPPGNRWAYWHVAEILPTYRVSRGDGPARELPRSAAAAGDLLAIPVTGAYSYTMANNYNGARRPPVIFVEDGQAKAVVRRETFDEMAALHQSMHRRQTMPSSIQPPPA